jgi:hypothetical protein
MFVFCHFKNPLALSFLICLLLAFNSIMPLLAVDNQLATASDPRFAGSLCLIPLFHFLFVIIAQKSDAKSVLTSLFQAGLMMLSFTMRSPAIVYLYLIVFWCVSKLVLQLKQQTNRISFVGTLSILWPAVMIFAQLGAIQVYRAERLNPYYFEQNTRGQHVFYHNIIMGLAVHPKLAQKYLLSISDFSVLDAVSIYADQHGQREALRQVFPQGRPLKYLDLDLGQIGYNVPAPTNYAETDRLAGLLLKDLLERNDSMDFVELVVFYKPRMIIRTFFWATGYGEVDIRDIGLMEHGLVAPAKRESSGLYLRLFRADNILGWIFTLVLFLLIIIKERKETLRHSIIIPIFGVATLLLITLVPALLTIPILYVLGDSFIIFVACVYILSLIGATMMVNILTRRMCRSSA